MFQEYNYERVQGHLSQLWLQTYLKRKVLNLVLKVDY